MIDKIKSQIWELMKEKQISLAMIYNAKGKILWHRGRDVVVGEGLSKGCGYCSTPALQSLKDHVKVLSADQIAATVDLSRSESAQNLKIKTVFVLPLESGLFLYLDSGIREGFRAQEISVFETLGALLSSVIRDVQAGGPGRKTISGTSSVASALRERLMHYAIEEEPVLILGETGVGKSLVAELIHHHSGRSGAFVVVNTPGIPESLLESQIFGHVKGAFSGAVAEARGFVTEAEKGTLFLDEIGDISNPVQAKLLRFIEERSYHRLGDSRERRADVRILAATNHDLRLAVKERRFREDLFFRLNYLTLYIPPLRERMGDMEVLIDENRNVLRGKELTSEAIKRMREYHWPGNIRELLQVLKVLPVRFSSQRIGREIEELLVFSQDNDACRLVSADGLWERIETGQDFWRVIKEPYMNRELNRSQVKAFLGEALSRCSGRYVELLSLVNLPASDYKSFMNFLYDNQLR